MLQECHRSVTRVLQECYKSVTGVLQECYRSVTRVLQECYNSVTRVLQECYKSVTGVLQCYNRPVRTNSTERVRIPHHNQPVFSSSDSHVKQLKVMNQ